ncbi:MAG: acyl-CoA dehydrogenase family protein [Dermatophilaceae bacterium]|nr:acyl-CoA dehydrogenase family protein [Dermatophilaceae bacterium]
MGGAKCVPKRLYPDFGRLGVTGIRIPQEYGGAGGRSWLYNVILAEEIVATGAVSGALPLHLNVVLPYFLKLANRAAGAMVPRFRLRRVDDGDRDDGARRRLGSCGHLGERGSRRRLLRPERCQDLHHRRGPGRPRHRGGPHLA